MPHQKTRRVVPLSLSPRDAVAAVAAQIYSIDKFLALQRYIETTSRWRVARVLFTTPLYGLLGALLPSLVPLQDPLDPAGVRSNPGFMVSVFLIYFVGFVGAFTHWRVATELPDAAYSVRHVAIISVVAAIVQLVFGVALAWSWRFPTPMSWIFAASGSGVSMSLGHLAAFRSRCWQDEELRRGLKQYMPAMAFQVTQIVIYPAFSVLFDHVSTLYQVLLTLLFPLLKFFLKRLLRLFTRELHDLSTEVAVSGIEICASLYQSMILTTAPSSAAMAIIMGVDVLQGLVTVKFFMDRKTTATTERHLVVSEAVKKINKLEAKHGSLRLADRVATYTSTSPGNSAAIMQALALINVVESILLVEYLEVAIPLVNALFIAVSCQFSSAQYNTRLRYLYFHPDALHQALGSIALYSVLQALSFVAMHLVMKYRYGLSAVYHLAFLLEHHQASIVGKTLAWLPIILHFTGVHYGVDFSFRFDFAAMLRDPTT